jgi:hypothetical protein
LDLAAAELDPAPAPEEPEEGEAEGRLSGAALADDAERVPLPDGQADPVNGLDVIDGAA